MKKLLCSGMMFFSMSFFLACGSTTTETSILTGALELVPVISSSVSTASVKAHTVDPNFNPRSLGSIPLFIFGNYDEVMDIAGNDASVTSYNLQGVFSNAKVILDVIPATANQAAGTYTATWSDYTFPVTLALDKAPTAATVSPFSFGSRSGATTYEHLRTGSVTCNEFAYTANNSTAWKADGDVFSMLYSEDSDVVNESSTDDSKYTIQGNTNTNTHDLLYNQATRSITVGADASTAKLSRIEVTGNTDTNLGLIRIVFINGNDKVSVVSKGIVGSGDTIMKVKAITDGSTFAAATEKWICVNTSATIEEFQAMGLNTNTATSAAGGKIQIANTSTGFTGTCATSSYIADVTSESFLDETSIPNTQSNYYSTLE